MNKSLKNINDQIKAEKQINKRIIPKITEMFINHKEISVQNYLKKKRIGTMEKRISNISFRKISLQWKKTK